MDRVQGDARSQFQVLSGLEKRLLELKVSQVDKFVAKAKETNPDKAVYGPQMVQKVLEFQDQFESMLARSSELRQSAEARWRVEEEALRGVALQEEEVARALQTRANEVRERDRIAREAEEQRLAEIARKEEEERAKKRKEREEREAEEQERERLLVEERARKKEVERQRDEHERQEREAVEAAQREAAETMTLDGAVRMLREGFRATVEDQRALLRVLQLLNTFLTNIVAEPSDPMFRKIRKDNQEVQKNFLQYRGALECLYSIGFREKRVPGSTDRRDGEVLYVMDEPQMTDIDVWLAWFEGLKAKSQSLEEDLEKLRRSL